MDLKEKIGPLVGTFTWSFGELFFIETEAGNFVWSDPEYGGDNTIVPFKGDYNKWAREMSIPFGRDKGKHIISEYCEF